MLRVLPATTFRESGNEGANAGLQRVRGVLKQGRLRRTAVGDELLGIEFRPFLPSGCVSLRSPRIRGSPQHAGPGIAYDGGQPAQRPVACPGDPVSPPLEPGDNVIAQPIL